MYINMHTLIYFFMLPPLRTVFAFRCSGHSAHNCTRDIPKGQCRHVIYVYTRMHVYEISHKGGPLGTPRDGDPTRFLLGPFEKYPGTYIHTYIPTYLHTYIHTYIHTCMHACMHGKC